MSKVTFITGNQGKADFLAKHVDYPIAHRKIDLDEIQSLNLEDIAGHKARQAFDTVKSPVLVEDVAFVLEELNGLPGPFIKWFESSIGLEGICRLADSLPSRAVTISVCFAYFDGKDLKYFIGSKKGSVSDRPLGSNGFGFDPIFIPEGHSRTFAQMTDKELEKYSLRTTTVYPKLRDFFERLDKIS